MLSGSKMTLKYESISARDVYSRINNNNLLTSMISADFSFSHIATLVEIVM